MPIVILMASMIRAVPAAEYTAVTKTPAICHPSCSPLPKKRPEAPPMSGLAKQPVRIPPTMPVGGARACGRRVFQECQAAAGCFGGEDLESAREP